MAHKTRTEKKLMQNRTKENIFSNIKEAHVDHIGLKQQQAVKFLSVTRP
jgi:hypothetical protein